MSRKYGTTSGNELESELKQVIVTASRSEFHFMSKIISENSNIWVKVFQNGRSKICGKQPLKNDNHEAQQQFNKEAFESLVKIIKHYSSI